MSFIEVTNLEDIYLSLYERPKEYY